MPADQLWINEDVNGIRVDVFEIGPPVARDDPEHYDAIGIDIETVDRYGSVVARISLRLSPHQAKVLIDQMHRALDAAKSRPHTE